MGASRKENGPVTESRINRDRGRTLALRDANDNSIIGSINRQGILAVLFFGGAARVWVRSDLSEARAYISARAERGATVLKIGGFTPQSTQLSKPVYS